MTEKAICTCRRALSGLSTVPIPEEQICTYRPLLRFRGYLLCLGVLGTILVVADSGSRWYDLANFLLGAVVGIWCVEVVHRVHWVDALRRIDRDEAGRGKGATNGRQRRLS